MISPEEIKAKRLSADLSRAEFAQLLEVSRQAVNQWELGTAKVSAINEKKIISLSERLRNKRIIENTTKLVQILEALADDAVRPSGLQLRIEVGLVGDIGLPEEPSE